MNSIRIGFDKSKKFYFSKKHILILYLLIFLWEDVVSRMIDISKESGMDIGIVEAAILLFTDRNYCMIFLVLFVILLYDYPMDGKWEQNIVYRTGKKSWHLGNVLYTLLIALIFIGEITFMTSIISSFYGSGLLTWSGFTTDLYYQSPEIFGRNSQLFISTEVVAQSSPIEALFHSMMLIILLMMVLSQIIFIFFMIGKKTVGVIFSIGIIMIGWILNILNMDIQWIFPFSHVLFGEHFRNILSQTNCTLLVSYIYFVVLNLLLFLVARNKLKRSTVW